MTTEGTGGGIDAALAHLSERDREVWRRVNDTRRPVDPTPLVARFRDAARRHAGRAAVETADSVVTYAELDAAARRVEALLRGLGVSEGARVALALPRVPALYAALLGVLGAGATYVPVDAGDPPDRVRHVLEDAGVAVLLTGDRPSPAAPAALPAGVALAAIDGAVEPSLVHRPGVRPASAHVSPGTTYVIYTSGTTGRPKGVRVGEPGLRSFVDWYVETHEVTPDARVAQNAPLGFDPSAQQILPALCTGATLCPVPEAVRRDPPLLARWLRDRAISHLDIVPPHWVQLLNAIETGAEPALRDLPALRWLVIGGDVLEHADTHRWHRLVRSPCRIDHVYGPTEATINATWTLVDPDVTDGRVPIGRPLPNMRVYVLDARGRLCPPNIQGELCLAGSGVALGYGGGGDGGRFVADAWLGPGERAYRTGDRGRLVVRAGAEPVFVFHGRLDQQVKVGGYRVEPAELEALVRAVDGVSDGAVVVVGEGGARRLVAFFVSRDVEGRRVREELSRSLPAHLVPADCVRVDALPLGPSGKVDRAELAHRYERLQRSRAPAPGVPLTPGEGAIAAAWTRLFGRRDFDRDDDFFEQGGNSFLALTFLVDLQASAGVTCRLGDLYTHPRLGDLAALLGSRASVPPGPAGERPAALGETAGVPAGEDANGPEITGLLARVLAPAHRLESTEELLPATPTDRRLLAAAPLQRTQIRLHLRLGCDDQTAAAAVGDAVAALPLLRSAMEEADGRPVHRVYQVTHLDLPVLDLTGVWGPARRERAVADLMRDGARPFDVTIAPRFRVAAVRVAERDLRILWWVSHSVCDGESSGLIVRQLRSSLRGAPAGRLPGVPDPFGQQSYGDYARHIDGMRWGDRALEEHRRRLERFDAAVARMRGRLGDTATARPASTSMMRRETEAGRLAGGGGLPVIQGRVVRAVARWTELDQIPMVTAYHGRSYGVRRFFGTFGNLVDAVPVLVDGARGDLESVVSRLAEATELADVREVNHARLRELLAGPGAPGPAGMEASPFALTFFEEVLVGEDGDGVEVVPVPEEPDARDEPSLEVTIRRRKGGLHLVLLATGIEPAALDRLWALI